MIHSCSQEIAPSAMDSLHNFYKLVELLYGHKMNYLIYEWKLQAARQRQSPSKTFYGLGIVPFSDLFFTGEGLIKGVIKFALNGTQLVFTTSEMRPSSSIFLWVSLLTTFFRLFFLQLLAVRQMVLLFNYFDFLTVRMIRNWVLFRFFV